MPTQSKQTRKRRANGEVVKKALISLNASDLSDLDAVKAIITANGRPVTNSRIYSVALKLLRVRLADTARGPDVVHWLFRA